MAKRRKVVEIVCYDYESMEEYEKHIPIMRERNWIPCDGTGYHLDTKEIVGDERWKVTAYFYKDLM